MPFLIAASNALEETKEQAYVTCPGIDDQEQIEAVQNKLSVLGGDILLSEGDFNCSAGLELGNAQYTIWGAGRATKLNFAFSSPGDCVAILEMSRGHYLRNLSIIGDKANTKQGLVVNDNTAYGLFENLWVEGIVENGVRGMPGNSQHTFRNVRVRDVGETGFRLSGLNNLFDGCAVTRSPGIAGQAAFWINEGSSTFINPFAERHNIGYVISSYAKNLSLPLLSAEACNVALRVTGDPKPQGIEIGTVMALMTQGATGPPIEILEANGVSIGNIIV